MHKTKKRIANTMSILPKIYVIAGCLAGIVLLVCAFIFLPIATIVISITSRAITNTTPVSANVNATNIDLGGNTIPAYYIDTNESSSSSTQATGQKQVGTPATGMVSILNSTANTWTIPKGTILTSNTLNYTYTFDKNVTVAAGSTTSSLSVTATTIGQQYAIAPDHFTISNQGVTPSIPSISQSVIVTSSVGFTGGEPVNATVVAQSDHDTLLKSLETQLYQKGRDELVAKLTSDMIEASDTLQNSDVSASFDANVGDKASVLNISLTTKTSVLVYKKSDIMKFGNSILSKEAGENETIANVVVNSSYQGYNKSTNQLSVKIQSSGAISPIIDTKNVIEHVKHGTVSQATDYIKQNKAVKDVSISVKPFWFGIFHLLPFKSSEITVTIKTG